MIRSPVHALNGKQFNSGEIMRTITIITLLFLLTGCATFQNKDIVFVEKNSEGKIVGSWELSAPAESHAELNKADGKHTVKVLYDGKSSNIVKDIIIYKMLDTKTSVGNQPGQQ